MDAILISESDRTKMRSVSDRLDTYTSHRYRFTTGGANHGFDMEVSP